MFSWIKVKLCVFFFVLLTLLNSCLRFPLNEPPIIIPFTLENNRIVIYATVNGIEGRFVWDTGSFDIQMLNYSSLENLTPLSFNVNPTLTKSYYIKNGIIINNQIIRSKSIINYLPTSEHPQMVYLLKYLNEHNFEGILGLAMFNGWWVEVSFSTNNIILHRRKPRSFTDFILARTTFRGLYCWLGAFFVTGIIDGVSFDFLVDTGVRYGLGFPHSVLECLDTNVYRKILTWDDTHYEIRTRNISLLSDVFLDKTIITDSFADHFGIPIMGLDFLQRYDFLFDMRSLNPRRERTRLYFKQRLEKTDKVLSCYIIFSNPYGIILQSRNDSLWVFGVTIPGFAHDVLGLMPDMTVTAINGHYIIGSERTRFYEFLAYLKDGGEGELTVLDADGAEHIITWQEEEYEKKRGFAGLWILENVFNRPREEILSYFALSQNSTGSDELGRFTWQLMDNGNILVFGGKKYDIELSENGTLLTFFYSGRDYTGRYPQKAMYRRR